MLAALKAGIGDAPPMGSTLKPSFISGLMVAFLAEDVHPAHEAPFKCVFKLTWGCSRNHRLLTSLNRRSTDRPASGGPRLGDCGGSNSDGTEEEQGD
jgi:hypothetical protein